MPDIRPIRPDELEISMRAESRAYSSPWSRENNEAMTPTFDFERSLGAVQRANSMFGWHVAPFTSAPEPIT